MSFEALGHAMRAKCPSTPKLVLIVLADWSGDGMYSYPSVPGISQRLNMPQEVVEKSLNKLCELGFLRIDHTHQHNGKSRHILERFL